MGQGCCRLDSRSISKGEQRAPALHDLCPCSRLREGTGLLGYGGYVFLYSSCGFLERREKGLPVVREGGDLTDVRTGTRRPDRTGGVTSLLAPSVASW